MTITVLSVVSAVWCYMIAKRQGRKGLWAILFGLLFNLFAVIGYYIAGDK